MTRPFFTVIALLFSATSFAQDYVILIKGDTLKGEVKILSYDLVDRAQLAEGKKKTAYTALQVRRVRMKDQDYAPVKYENSIRLMKVLRSGTLSLYSFRAPGQTSYDMRILQKMGMAAIEVPNIGFKKYVGEMVSDCPTVSDKVKNGDYDRFSIENMVGEYNDCIADFTERRIESAQKGSTKPGSSPATDLIEQMKTKVNTSDLSNKSEVNDLLSSIADRVKKNESVPAYMKEGLKGYLSSSGTLKADMEQLFTLIDK